MKHLGSLLELGMQVHGNFSAQDGEEAIDAGIG